MSIICRYFFTVRSIHIFFSFLLLLLPINTSFADQIRIAVASNFTNTLRAIVKKFELASNHKVVVISGSTGKHYAQIINGAPFDVFLAADSRRPSLLEEKRIALPSSRFTYAVGKIVLWSPTITMDKVNENTLNTIGSAHLAMANARLAPYGFAAKEVLVNLNLWKKLQKNIIRGENINQAFQFVYSKNAKYGLVSLAQIRNFKEIKKSSYWEVPQSLYTKIEQQAVILNNTIASKEFMLFLKSDDILRLIENAGYHTY